MSMKRILITGGAGFIGSHTADALLCAGYSVRILDILDPQIHGRRRQFPSILDPRIERMRGDVRCPRDLTKALENVDVVYHLAAFTGVGQSMYEISNYVDNNVGGTAALLQVLAHSKHRIQRLILASSRAIYGEGNARCSKHGVVSPLQRERGALENGDFNAKCPRCCKTVEPIPTPEGKPANPGSIYAVTKKHQEDLCIQACSAYGLSLVILRYFNVYGSRQALQNPYTGVITVFFNRLRDGSPISLYEDGIPTRDFVHVSDVVQANIAALNPQLSSGSIFNIGNGIPVTIRELAQALGEVMGCSPNLESKGEFRLGDILSCTSDLNQSHRILGYSPKISLRKGLAEFLEWAKRRRVVHGSSYEQTVRELKQHGLFGHALSS